MGLDGRIAGGLRWIVNTAGVVIGYRNPDTDKDQALNVGGGGSWGSITGTLADQTDLQAAINAKADSSHSHAISDSTGLQAALDAKAPLASPTFTGTPAGPTPAAGTNTTQLATTAYVVAALASIAANLGKRGRVRAATTANITIATALNNGDTLDGVTLATGDWVLVKDQTAPAENGVYEVGASPARVGEFDAYDEHPGALIAVQEGTTLADTLWLCTSNVGGTLNTTAIAFSQFSAAGALLAANNLSDLANAATARSNLGLTALATTTPGTGVATFLATPSSANLRSAITDEDGDGALLFANAPVTLTGATNLVRSTHGNRLVILNAGSDFTVTIEDDTAGSWQSGDQMVFVNIGAGIVTIAGDGTAVVTAAPGYALTIPQHGFGTAQRSGANAWKAGGQFATQAQATWEAGVGTTESVVSPAKIAAAITALGGGGGGAFGGFMDNGPSFIDTPVGLTNTLSSSGMGAGANVGTGASVAARTSLYDTSYNFTLVTITATAGSNAFVGRRTSTAGIGFFAGGAGTAPVKARLMGAPADANASGCRFILGLTGGTGSGEPGATTEPSAMTDCVFMGADSTDTNMQIMHNDASGTCTKVDLGASFPANGNASEMYEVTFYDVPGASREIRYVVRERTTSNSASGTLTTNLPTAGVRVCPVIWRNAVANSGTSPGIAYGGMYTGLYSGIAS
jgi:hypothetical protein